MKSKRQFKPAGKYLLQHTGSKVFYFFKWQDGAAKRVSLQTTSKEQAGLLRDLKLKELARVAEHKDGDILPLDSTFAALARVYVEQVQASNQIKASSKLYYTECLGVIEKTFKGWGKPVKAITALDCVDWGHSLRIRYSGPRFNGILSQFRNVLERAVMADLVPKNHGQRIERAAVPIKEPPVPTQEQFATLIATLKKQGWGRTVRAAKVVQFLAYTGLRINEARQLLWSDVRWWAPTPDAPNVHGEIIVRAEITKRREHRLPLFAETVEVIREWEKARSRGEFVLPLRECYRALRKASRTMGIPTLTHHDFRHLFTTMCIERGVDCAVVSRWLGHANASLVNTRYRHVRDEFSRAESAKVSFKSPSNVVTLQQPQPPARPLSPVESIG